METTLANTLNSMMALPFLPGNTFDKNLGKTKFHKSHCFDFNADLPVFHGDAKPGIGGEFLPGQAPIQNHSTYPKETGLPAWVAFDRQVLRFYAYFQEAIEEKQEEKHRIRNCIILFYPEDDSIQVNEEKMDNSGIPQGTLIRRHRIPYPPPNDHFFYTIEDFNIGKQVQFYSKVFEITGCDKVTETFLRKLGVKISSYKDTPPDPYTEHRKKMLGAMQPQRPYEKIDTLEQFLKFDRNVLRFFCYWDDTDSMFGDPRELVLHYFLADDTIEILEKLPPNSGRDALPVFLKRGPLPKEPPTLPLPGVQTKRTVLNVFGPTGHGGRYILDSLKTGAIQLEYYHENDFRLGAALNVWGRKVVLCDCDEFTKEFYHSKYGIETFEPVKIPQPTPNVIKAQIPPYNGLGSEEDSLQSCISLIPKPPQKDFVKFMMKDRNGLNSNILRFVAHMKTANAIDAERKFIVYYYLSDDTIAVHEPPIQNSGIIGGRFLERGRVAKPKRNPNNDTTYYHSSDFYIGSEVIFNKYKFTLTDADKYAFKYMENHCDQYPHANIKLILLKLRGPATAHVERIQSVFADADRHNTGAIPLERFRLLVKELAQGLLNDHEVITLTREYGEKKTPPLDSLLHLIQSDLKRKNFINFDLLQETMQSADSNSNGYISKQELQHACHLLKVPISDQLLEASLMNCATNQQGHIKYEEFINYLNWVDHPAPPEKPKAAAGSSGNWDGFGDKRETVSVIYYKKLVQDLTQ